MKHTVYLISSLSITPQRFTGGKNVVLFSDWPLTVVANGRAGERKYERTMFLTLRDVEDFWILRENVGTVPNGLLDIYTFDHTEFSPPSFRPIDIWGNETIDVSVNTAIASPQIVMLQLPGTAFGVLTGISLSASSSAVALTRVRILDNQGAPVDMWGQRFAAAQFKELQLNFPGIKVPNIHNIELTYTPTGSSTTNVTLNYKIGGA